MLAVLIHSFFVGYKRTHRTVLLFCSWTEPLLYLNFCMMKCSSVGRSGDRARGQVHGSARHVPFGGESLAARVSALQAKAHGEVDRQLSLGHG